MQHILGAILQMVIFAVFALIYIPLLIIGSLINAFLFSTTGRTK